MNDSTDVLGRRIGAGLIDVLLLFVVMLVLGILIGDTASGDGKASVSLTGKPFLVFVAVLLAYYGITEGLTGQTLGKRLLRIRVVAADGQRAGAGPIAIRTLLRLIDGIAIYLVGLIVVLATGERRQRLGDLAAGTRVVAA